MKFAIQNALCASKRRIRIVQLALLLTIYLETFVLVPVKMGFILLSFLRNVSLARCSAKNAPVQQIISAVFAIQLIIFTLQACAAQLALMELIKMIWQYPKNAPYAI